MHIDADAFKAIANHAKRVSPLEACGVLGGLMKEEPRVISTSPCDNIDEKPHVSYTIESRELLKIIDEIERGGLEVVGFYHSHPLSSPVPSIIDMERATWDGFYYLIYSVQSEKARAWKWVEEGQKFIEEMIRIS